jgi:hypothetical protein
MSYSPDLECAAFVGHHLIASGPLAEVVHEAKRTYDENPNQLILIFENQTARVIEIDFRGSVADVFQRLEKQQSPQTIKKDDKPKKPGRPKLGVVSKEVTLLPKHWEWLAEQRGGASVTLRRLVGEAMNATSGEHQKRRMQQVVYHLMTSIAGDLPNYEEAIRALFASEREKFFDQIKDWPAGLRGHLTELAQGAFDDN